MAGPQPSSASSKLDLEGGGVFFRNPSGLRSRTQRPRRPFSWAALEWRRSTSSSLCASTRGSPPPWTSRTLKGSWSRCAPSLQPLHPPNLQELPRTGNLTHSGLSMTLSEPHRRCPHHRCGLHGHLGTLPRTPGLGLGSEGHLVCGHKEVGLLSGAQCADDTARS